MVVFVQYEHVKLCWYGGGYECWLAYGCARASERVRVHVHVHMYVCACLCVGARSIVPYNYRCNYCTYFPLVQGSFVSML